MFNFRLTAGKASNVVDTGLTACTGMSIACTFINVRTGLSISGKSGVTKKILFSLTNDIRNRSTPTLSKDFSFSKFIANFLHPPNFNKSRHQAQVLSFISKK